MLTPAINTAALYFTERLSAALESIAATPLILVEAPMGYGKTVAVREYVRKRGTRTVWTSVLNAGEDVFWRDFCRALAQAFPNNIDMLESLSRIGYPRDAVLVDAARELLQGLDFGSETLLVVDDAHLLPDYGSEKDGANAANRNGGMAALCSLLARLGLDGLHIVLISRDIWPGNGPHGRASLALKGQLAVIDRETLALNAKEIQEYFALCGLPVTPKEATTLREATGGWISALYLYLLRYSKDGVFPSPDSPPDTPQGGLARPDSVDALLEREIFSLLSETARDLLLALSPLDRFTLPQAEFLLGNRDGAGDVLAGLQRENSFINYDPADKTYALHSLFRHYLSERFEQLPTERRNAVYIRLADWYERQQDAIAAIEFRYRAEEFERALSILESDMSRNMVTEKSRFFVDLFKACPEDILDRHMGAAFKYAIAAFAAGNYPAFGSQLAWIGKKCGERMAARGENDPEAKIWRGELEFLLSLGAYNDIAAMSVHHRKANELLGRPTKLFGPDSPWTLGCPSVLFMFHRQSGKLDEELALMDECLPHYYTLAAMHGAGGECQMRAEALYQQGDFTGAAICCHRAEAMSRMNGQVSVELCSLFLHLRLALMDGAFEKARNTARSMRGLIHDKRSFFLLHTVDLCEGYLHTFTGNSRAITDWLRFGAGGENRLYTFAGGYYYVEHGRVLLLEGEYAAVTGLFPWLLQSGAFANHLMFSIYAHIYMAAAYAALERKAEADTALRTALALALPDKLYMPFAENADFLPQLKTLARKSPDRQNIRKIIRLAVSIGKLRDKAAKRDVPHTASGSPSLLGLLTRRERELVELALTGKTYPAIAETLGLAPSTVKRAFGIVYKKLGIHSRKQLAAVFSKK